jgi:hypothetical protein
MRAQLEIQEIMLMWYQTEITEPEVLGVMEVLEEMGAAAGLVKLHPADQVVQLVIRADPQVVLVIRLVVLFVVVADMAEWAGHHLEAMAAKAVLEHITQRLVILELPAAVVVVVVLEQPAMLVLLVMLEHRVV